MARKKITATPKKRTPRKETTEEEKKPEQSDTNSSDDEVLRKVVQDVNKKTRRRSNNGGTSAPMAFNVSDDDSDSSQPTEPEKRTKQDASKSPRRERASTASDKSSVTPKKRRISGSPAKATPAKRQKEDADSEGENEDENGIESSAASKEETPKKRAFYEGPKLYEVEKVVGHEGEGKNRYFQIRWKGYPPEEDTWEPITKLSCPRLIAEYYEQNPDAEPVRKPRTVKKSNRKKKNPIVIVRKPKIDEQDDYDSDMDNNQEWEVDKILDVLYRRDKKREFLIRWKDYSKSSDSWEPEENLDCPELIAKFMSKMQRKAEVDERELRQVRIPTQRYTLMTQSAARRLSKRNQGSQRVHYHDAE